MKNTFWMGLTLLTASWACSSSSDPRENLEALSAEVAQYDTYEVSENYSARDARMRLESEYEYIEATVPHESESLVAITWELYRNGETSFMTGLYAPKNNFNPLTSNGVLKGRWVMYQDVDGDGDQEIILEDVTDYGPQAGGSFSLYSQDSESVYQPLGSAFGEWIYNGTKGYVDNVEIKIGEEDGRATISAEHYYTTEEMKTEPDEVEIYFYSEAEGFVADSRQYLYITSIEARAYNRPEAGAQVVMRLEEGDKLEVLETGDVGTINTQIDRWYRVQGPTTDGWVFGTQTSVAAPIMVDLAEDGALEVLVRSYDQQLDEYTSDFTEYTCEYKIVEGMDYKYLVVARECSEDVNPSFIYMSFYSFLREDQWSIDYEKLDLYQWWDFTCSEDGDEEYSLYCVNDGVITALVSVVDRVVENGELIGVSGYDIEFELSMNDMGELYFEILDGVEEGI